jgi:hypothetical protein
MKDCRALTFAFHLPVGALEEEVPNTLKIERPTLREDEYESCFAVSIARRKSR